MLRMERECMSGRYRTVIPEASSILHRPMYIPDIFMHTHTDTFRRRALGMNKFTLAHINGAVPRAPAVFNNFSHSIEYEI
jgi:hypothetical protein